MMKIDADPKAAVRLIQDKMENLDFNDGSDRVRHHGTSPLAQDLEDDIDDVDVDEESIPIRNQRYLSFAQVSRASMSCPKCCFHYHVNRFLHSSSESFRGSAKRKERMFTGFSDPGPSEGDMKERVVTSKQFGTSAPMSTMTGALFQAIADGRLSRIKYYLDHGVRIRACNEAGENMLIVALRIPDSDVRNKVFRYLLRRGADCHQVDQTMGRDVLMWAAYYGCQVPVEIILDVTMGDIDLLQRDNQGMTALHFATMTGNPSLVELILDAMQRYGLPVDLPDAKGLTPFIYAMRLGHLHVAELLVEYGHASRYQFDTKTFLTADEWASVGIQERRLRARKEMMQQVTARKVKGKLPPMEKYIIPKLIVTSPSKNNFNMTFSGRLPQLSKCKDHDDAKASAKPYFCIEPGSEPGGSNLNVRRLTRTSEEAVMALLGWSSKGVLGGPGKSVSKSNPEWSSHQNRNKSGKMYARSAMTLNLSDLLDTFSEQLTSSYRTTVVSPRVEDEVLHEVVHTRNKKGEKVSTLAILFGKDKNARRRKNEKDKKSRSGGKTKTKPARQNATRLTKVK